MVNGQTFSSRTGKMSGLPKDRIMRKKEKILYVYAPFMRLIEISFLNHIREIPLKTNLAYILLILLKVFMKFFLTSRENLSISLALITKLRNKLSVMENF